MYQQVGAVAYKADLSNTLALCTYLNHPERGFKAIHVAGTNGKGSTSHMLASVLQEAGYTVGLYTSPHLKDFRERIKINGQPIPKRTVSSFVAKHQDFFIHNKLSFFEMTVGLAFSYFKDQNIDIAVVEVGLGGRLDSTNVILPELSVITNIGMDHTAFLGNTLPKIAFEKAGIIKPNTPVVIGEFNPETFPVFQEVAAKNKAPLLAAWQEEGIGYPTDLKGSYQKLNKRTAFCAISQLRRQGFTIPEQHLKNGLAKVVANTGLLGRWQELGTAPLIIADTAHNQEGLHYVTQQLKSMNYKHLHIVIGMVSDKDATAILKLFPKEATYYYCAANNKRAIPAVTLQKHANPLGLKGSHYGSVKQAFKAAKKAAHTTDLIFIGGSTFTVAEIL